MTFTFAANSSRLLTEKRFTFSVPFSNRNCIGCEIEASLIVVVGARCWCCCCCCSICKCGVGCPVAVSVIWLPVVIFEGLMQLRYILWGVEDIGILDVVTVVGFSGDVVLKKLEETGVVIAEELSPAVVALLEDVDSVSLNCVVSCLCSPDNSCKSCKLEEQFVEVNSFCCCM